MENWIDRTLHNVHAHVEQAKELRKQSLEIRFRENLYTIEDLLNQHKLVDAEAELRALTRRDGFNSELTPAISRLYKKVELTLQIANRQNVLSESPKRSQLEGIRNELLEIERKAMLLDLWEVVASAKAVRTQIHITDARLRITPSNRVLTRLNIGTFVILVVLSILTALPLIQGRVSTATDAESWWYSLHPEMLGGAITFILLSVVFETSRRNQEIRQIQYSCYEELLNTSTVTERQRIIDRMRRENLLRGAYLAGVDWGGLNLCGADLFRAVLRDGRNIEKALFDTATKLPNGRSFDQTHSPITNFDSFINPPLK